MGVINLARSLIPPKLCTPLRRWVYSCIPMEKRMGNKHWQLKSFLQEAQWWDRERIEAWELEKLKEIIWHVYENVLVYREFSREAGIKLNDMATLADVRVLPFMAKELISGNLKDLTPTIFFPGV